uniref:B30.2/SPRY domain-containing protein n=1 Tax=Neolamprologus brichardi TaxID=32507 RepID=A0A3Q4HG17_NEOBR
MCKKLENIEEQINTLSSTINDIETALKAQDVQLLQVHLLSLFTSCGRHCQMWWVKKIFYSKVYSKSMQYSSKKLLPNNPERLVSRISVLGATGFTSGKHSWTVDVGQGQDWYIGVALDSIQRQNTIFLSPAEGFWVIGLSNGDSLWAQTTPHSKLPMKEKPNRITVELDYEKGKVVFINAADSTKIHTFKDKFTEKVFSYFSPGLCKDVQNATH